MNRFGDYDVVVVEGTVAGVTAAIRLAHAGLHVALVMSGSSPLFEFTTCMGALLSVRERETLPPELDLCFPESRASACGEGWLYPHAAIAEAVEDSLIDAGVAIFYDAHPGGVLFRGGEARETPCRVEGIVFGGSFGVAAATASACVDCTHDGFLVRAAGGARHRREGQDHALCSSFLHTGTEHCAPHTWIALGDGLRIRFHGHLAEVRFAYAGGEAGAAPCGAAQRHRALRDTLITHARTWSAAHPGIPFAIRRVADDMLVVEPTYVSLDAGRGVHLLSVAGDARRDAAAYLDQRTRMAADVTRVVAAVRADLETSGPVLDRPRHYVLSLPGRATGTADTDSRDQADACQFGLCDPRHDEPQCDQIAVSLGALPVRRRAAVIVCGLGTSGIEAARSAAAHGLAPIGFETHGDVGGVNTVGGVPVYWYGRRTPYFKRWHRALKEKVRADHIPAALALYDQARRRGVELNLKTPCCGVVTQADRVTGVVCIGDDGLFLACGTYVVDASGAGDIAAWRVPRIATGPAATRSRTGTPSVSSCTGNTRRAASTCRLWTRAVFSTRLVVSSRGVG